MVSSAQLSSAVLYPPQKYFGVHPRGFWGFWGCALMDITVREYLMEQWDRGKSLERTNFRGDSRAEQTGQRWGDPKESEPPSLGSPSPSQKQQGGNGNTDVNGGGQGAHVPQGTAEHFWVLGNTGGVSQTPGKGGRCSGATVGRVPGMCVRATGTVYFSQMRITLISKAHAQSHHRYFKCACVK